MPLTGPISMDEAADKQRLRAAARKLRAAAQADDLESKAAEQLAAHFLAAFSLPQVGSHAVVAGYWPLGSEMDVRPLMIRLAAAGVELALPVTRAADRPLEFRHWRPGDELERGAHGVSQPKPSAPVAIPTLLLVPLLAFDADGWRLGYGAGYYDRTLAELRGRLLETRPLAIGIAYAVQEMTELPRHAGDQRLDGVVTERAARRFG
jgi:5-formyltetrahydrofolate cyclo-ligase